VYGVGLQSLSVDPRKIYLEIARTRPIRRTPNATSSTSMLEVHGFAIDVAFNAQLALAAHQQYSGG
jgi:hypothetical protein